MPSEDKEQLNVFKSGKSFGQPGKEKEKEKKKLPPVLLSGGKSSAGWLGRIFSAPMNWLGRFFSSVFGFGGLERMLGVRAFGSIVGQRILALFGLLVSSVLVVVLGVILAGADSFLADFGLKLPGNMGFWAQDLQRSRFTARLNSRGEVEDEDWLARRGKRSGRFGAGSGSGLRDELQPDIRMKGGTGAGDSLDLFAKRNIGQLGNFNQFSTGGGSVNIAGTAVIEKNVAAVPAVLKINPATIITPLLKTKSQPVGRSALGGNFQGARLGALGNSGRLDHSLTPTASGTGRIIGGAGAQGTLTASETGEAADVPAGSLVSGGVIDTPDASGTDGALTFPITAPSGAVSGPCSDVACVAVPETTSDADVDVTPATQTSDPVGPKALEQIEGMVAKCSQINTGSIEAIAVGMDDCWDGTKTDGGTVGIGVPELDKVADVSGIQSALDDMNTNVAVSGGNDDGGYVPDPNDALEKSAADVNALAWDGVKAIAALVLAKVTPIEEDDKAAEDWIKQVQRDLTTTGNYIKNDLGHAYLGDTVLKMAEIVGSATEDGFWGRIGDLISAVFQYFLIVFGS